MIILHGALLDDALFLWGESPAEGAAQSKVRRRPDRPSPYPYDAGAEAVTRAARELPIAFRPTARRKAEATAWLPTRGDHPLPSSALIGEAPDSAEPLESAPWLVEGISLDRRRGARSALGLRPARGHAARRRRRARPAVLDPRGAARGLDGGAPALPARHRARRRGQARTRAGSRSGSPKTSATSKTSRARCPRPRARS